MQAGREIKFRGMDLDGQWHYGNLAVLVENVRHLKQGHYISNSVGLPFAYQVRPETVGQFIGLPDKNVKEIYERDIAKNKHGAIGVIKFHKSWGGFYFDTVLGLNEEKELVRMSSAVAMWNDWGTLEVIGNIYENPELLEVGK
ncbi:YopX family protein [Brevibacillus sp. AG]|uniref:YopX family protein n=1 Tax=Brevibacillus sp. AG TaxID=3020891 RepID=UPI0023307FA2|nr:YopX family protein [Brevibacillus sp. AG]MDC0763436.1 YopX family protein [Brevibacillus sp. AG]